MSIPVKAGDHMPVQMRHHVSQRRKVDLGRLQMGTQGLLHFTHYGRAQRSIWHTEVRELSHVRRLDDPVKSRKARLVGADHPEFLALKHQSTAKRNAQRASCIFHTLHQHTFNTTIISELDIIRQPLLTQNLPGHLDHDVVRFEQATFQVLAKAA